MEQDFNSIYTHLEPALKTLEAKRVELKAKGTRKGLIAGGICCLAGLVIMLLSKVSGIALVIPPVIGLIVLFYCINSQSGKLSFYYKTDIISKIISTLCETTSYKPDQGISEQTFVHSKLFSTPPDRYRSEDLITGVIGKTNFECSEIVAEEKQVIHDKKGRRETWVDIFRGFFFIADFQKDFKGDTLIYRNAWIKPFFNSERVKLENQEFKKSFDVYSSDQVEARYLLSPAIMEKLLELDRKFPGKITVSFRHSLIVIAIPDSKNHFETSIWTSQTNNSQLKQEFNTLKALFNIVNDLNLNLRVWTKE